MTSRRLKDLARARSGDKGRGANIGVIANSEADYRWLCENLSAARVQDYFAAMSPGEVVRYEIPSLHALNFVLPTILGEGGSRSLRVDAQGKTLGQVLLEMPVEDRT
jgi:hypothetical protein